MKTELTREEIQDIVEDLQVSGQRNCRNVAMDLSRFLESAQGDKFILSDTADVNAKYNHLFSPN